MATVLQSFFAGGLCLSLCWDSPYFLWVFVTERFKVIAR